MYLFKNIVFNCKKATLLSIKREQGQITFLERLELSYHLLYCDPCKNFIEQSKLIQTAGKGLEAKLQSQPPFSLPAAAREKIQNKLSEEL